MAVSKALTTGLIMSLHKYIYYPELNRPGNEPMISRIRGDHSTRNVCNHFFLNK